MRIILSLSLKFLINHYYCFIWALYNVYGRGILGFQFRIVQEFWVSTAELNEEYLISMAELNLVLGILGFQFTIVQAESSMVVATIENVSKDNVFIGSDQSSANYYFDSFPFW